MKLNFKLLSLLLFFILSTSKGFSQIDFTNEIGIVVGPVAFQSDFGEREDFETNSGNTGFGIGVLHFINFNYKKDFTSKNLWTFFNDHFKIRNELTYNRTKLNHFGKWVDEFRSGMNTEKLRGHSGLSQNINLGSQLEFFLRSIREFENSSRRGNNLLAPYISLGAQISYSNPSVSTSYGDGNINNPNNFYGPWVQATNPNFNEDSFLFNDSQFVFSLVGSIGTRYKLNPLSDIVIDLKWQFFLDDRVDGLDHNLTSNKSNDWLLWLNFSYVHYLNNN
jgi:hypothetical protein